MFTLTLSVKHYTDEAGIEHIDIDQTLSGAISGTSENRPLDWQERDEQDDVFGLVTEKTRRMPLEEVTDEFLKKDWTQDTIDNQIVFVDSWSTPDKNRHVWRAVQVIASSSFVAWFSPTHKSDVGILHGEWGETTCQTRHLHFTSEAGRRDPRSFGIRLP